MNSSSSEQENHLKKPLPTISDLKVGFSLALLADKQKCRKGECEEYG